MDEDIRWKTRPGLIAIISKQVYIHVVRSAECPLYILLQ
jgi:hypothetical protein